jgi:hypothetical protein
MRLYFDTCSLQRPLDDRIQTRIVLEAEAVLALLAYCERCHADLIVSDMMEQLRERLHEQTRYSAQQIRERLGIQKS